jgi:hypothetical protein
MADGFGKISIDLACRFGELTANESRVLVYLYCCRNEETGQCNPSRKTISNDAKIEKGNLSKAVAGLEEKGWILEDENGHFKLFSASEIKPKVVELTTRKVVKSPTKVVEVTTKVVELTTESCRTNNSHIKELNRERTEKEQRTKNIVADKPQPPAAKESELSILQKQEFTEGMSFLKTKIGKYPDGGAQGKSLKWMLQNGASILQVRRGLERQIAEYQGRYRASYLTLSKDIFRWIEETNGEILIDGKISNTNDRTAQTAKQIEGSQRLDAIIADAERFKSPTIN